MKLPEEPIKNEIGHLTKSANRQSIPSNAATAANVWRQIRDKSRISHGGKPDLLIGTRAEIPSLRRHAGQSNEENPLRANAQQRTVVDGLLDGALTNTHVRASERLKGKELETRDVSLNILARSKSVYYGTSESNACEEQVVYHPHTRSYAYDKRHAGNTRTRCSQHRRATRVSNTQTRQRRRAREEAVELGHYKYICT